MRENLERWASYIMNDTSDQRQPKVGDKMISPFDTVEITKVSAILVHPSSGYQDRKVAFKVIEVHSPEDSALTLSEDEHVEILFGDMVHGDPPDYNFVDEKIPGTMTDSFVLDKIQGLLDEDSLTKESRMILNKLRKSLGL